MGQDAESDVPAQAAKTSPTLGKQPLFQVAPARSDVIQHRVHILSPYGAYFRQ